MTIQEKLSSFDVEEPRLHVFHEGMFAKLYNESAFLFTEHVRRYKVNVTDCKRGRYYSLGFPFFALAEADARKAARTPKAANAAPQAEVRSGKEGGDTPAILPQTCTPDSMRAILADVLRFRLESASPLECMLFLQSVQKRCYGALPESSGI